MAVERYGNVFHLRIANLNQLVSSMHGTANSPSIGIMASVNSVHQ